MNVKKITYWESEMTVIGANPRSLLGSPLRTANGTFRRLQQLSRQSIETATPDFVCASQKSKGRECNGLLCLKLSLLRMKTGLNSQDRRRNQRARCQMYSSGTECQL
jgi:hypothetical protein